MKVVNDFNSFVTPRAGCVCASGHARTRGLWDPLFDCKCGCKDTNKNSKANRNKAKNM